MWSARRGHPSGARWLSLARRPRACSDFLLPAPPSASSRCPRWRSHRSASSESPASNEVCPA
eukprot:8344816-Alexandrium_andersonii.AAC.1